MSDYGLYSALEDRIKEVLPTLSVRGCFPTEEIIPPYIIIQQKPFEPAPLPQRAGRIDVSLTVISCYRGRAEILDIIQKLINMFDGKSLPLKDQIWAVLKEDKTSLELMNDHITHKAHLTFSVLLRFLSNT